MSTIDQSAQIQQDEGKLEGPPLRFGQCLRVASRAGITAARGSRDGEIYKAERGPRLGVPGQYVDAGGNARLCRFHVLDELFARLAAPMRKSG